MELKKYQEISENLYIGPYSILVSILASLVWTQEAVLECEWVHCGYVCSSPPRTN